MSKIPIELFSNLSEYFEEIRNYVFSCDIWDFDTSEFDDNFCLELFDIEFYWELV